MPFAEWMPRLELQVESLDAQHRTLFAWINRLWDAYQADDRAALLAVLGFLCDYADLHFAEEEALMARTGYDQEQAHRGLHQQFRSTVRRFALRLEGAPHSVALELLGYLRDWLVHHIGQEDRRLGAFLRDRGLH